MKETQSVLEKPDGRLDEAKVNAWCEKAPDGERTNIRYFASWLCRLGDEHWPLPVTFDPADEHHLRLEKWADRLSMWLDGHPIAEIEVPADPSRFALFTDGAAAAFRDVSFTGLA